MRQLRQLFLAIGLSTAVAAPVLVSSDAQADARADARTHYLAGVKAYNAGDYKSAIREFSAAQSLAPADLNNYNLALCYDKLGDAEPAIQYYKAYLDKVPATDKRAEIEASITRLDAAVKSAAAKKAEEERRAEEAKKQIEAKRIADEEAAKKRAEEEAAKKKAEEEAKRVAEDPYKDPDPGPAPPVGVGSTGTPGSGQVRPTGDAQLDRVQQINIDEIRDQRVGGAGSGMADRKQPPSDPRVARDPRVASAEPPPAADANDPRAAAGNGTQGPAADPSTAPTDKPKPTPVYKKWWFWAVVAVSAYVVISIASEDSRSSNTARTLPLPEPGGSGGVSGGAAGGLTLMRF